MERLSIRGTCLYYFESRCENNSRLVGLVWRYATIIFVQNSIFNAYHLILC